VSPASKAARDQPPAQSSASDAPSSEVEKWASVEPPSRARST
jgi:hypothetical protein